MCDEKQEVAIATKVCKCCGKELPIDEFSIHGRSKDGHSYVCKACKSRYKASKKEGCNPRLLDFSPRELIEELRARGYTGKLVYVVRREINV